MSCVEVRVTSEVEVRVRVAFLTRSNTNPNLEHTATEVANVLVSLEEGIGITSLDQLDSTWSCLRPAKCNANKVPIQIT